MKLLALGLAGESLPLRTDENLKAHPNRWAFTFSTPMFRVRLQHGRNGPDTPLLRSERRKRLVGGSSARERRRQNLNVLKQVS
jgi:hypothetical protein